MNLDTNSCAQSKIEGRPLAWFTLSPYSTSMAAYDPFHRSQTYAEAPGIFSPLEALERDEEVPRICKVKAGSVVSNETGRNTINQSRPDLDDRFIVDVGVFPGITGEVIHDHPEQTRISVDHYSFFDPDCDSTLRFGQLQFRCRRLRQRHAVLDRTDELRAGGRSVCYCVAGEGPEALWSER